MKKLLTCFAVLLGSCAENHVASAQGTHAWNDPAGGIYGLANNWTPLGFPSSLDTARFALNEQYTVSFNQSQQAALLQVAFGDVTFRGTGIFSGDRSYTLANADVDDFGRLTLVHNDAQSHSFELLATSLLTVAGEMHITQGTKLTSPLDAEVDGPDINTAGVLRVTGSKAARPSLWEANNVTIGKLNRGLLAIEEGGQAIIDDLTVGAGSGSFGQVDVVGVGSDNSPSTLTVDEREIGDQGNGLLNVTGGAEVNVRRRCRGATRHAAYYQ